MNKEMDMREVLEKVKQGEISVEEAEHYFRKAPFDEMGYAKLDMHRQIRSGFPEVIFCSGKADAHLVPIVKQGIVPGKGIFHLFPGPSRDAQCLQTAQGILRIFIPEFGAFQIEVIVELLYLVIKVLCCLQPFRMFAP